LYASVSADFSLEYGSAIPYGWIRIFWELIPVPGKVNLAGHRHLVVSGQIGLTSGPISSILTEKRNPSLSRFLLFLTDLVWTLIREANNDRRTLSTHYGCSDINSPKEKSNFDLVVQLLDQFKIVTVNIFLLIFIFFLVFFFHLGGCNATGWS
jgi:hypothetical protein